MSGVSERSVIVEVVDLREFFHDSMQEALLKQRVQVEAETEHYVVNVLVTFSRSEDRFEADEPGGRATKPLALMLAEAQNAPTRDDRDRCLRRLGDVALFTAGFFAASFARKLIDIDYHIAMGSGAYASLAASSETQRRRAPLTPVFLELADKFQRMVDVLNEVAEMSHAPTEQDVLRQYEIYLKTGSPRALRILRELGIDPVASAGQTAQ